MSRLDRRAVRAWPACVRPGALPKAEGRALTRASGAAYLPQVVRPGEVAHPGGPGAAERYKLRLLQAADKGEAFDVESGLPESLARELAR